MEKRDCAAPRDFAGAARNAVEPVFDPGNVATLVFRDAGDSSTRVRRSGTDALSNGIRLVTRFRADRRSTCMLA
jgi:hypothetical protein